MGFTRPPGARGGAAAVRRGALALALLAPLGARAQSTGIVEGRVTDAANGRPLANAQVAVIGTTLGAITNDAGAYRLTGLPARPLELRVRLVGFRPSTRAVTVVAGQTTRADVALTASALQLEQIVVSGTGGAVETKKLGNTIAVVKPPEEAPIRTFSEVLQGREPGLVGLPSGGMTGEGARIRIRGNASISQSNEPIIFVDGVRINAAGGFGQNINRNGGSPSRLDDIDPTTIERIEILKGAAAATLYGTEASNGVIQIFTKKGASGAPRWDLNVEQAASRFPLDRFPVNAGFATRQGQADSLSVFYGRTIRPFELIERNIWKDNMTETGYGQTYAGSVRGGSQAAQYFVSGRYNTEDGPLSGTLGGRRLGPAEDVNRRSTATARLDFQPRANLRLGVTSAYTGTWQETPSNSNDITGFVSQAYLAKPENANCRLTVQRDPSTAATMGVKAPGICAGPGNPFGNGAFATIAEAAQLRTQQDVQRFRSALEAQLQVTDALVLSATGGIDVTAQRSWSQLPFGNNIDGQISTNPLGQRTAENVNDRQLTLDTRAEWKTGLTPWARSALAVGAQGFFSRTVNLANQAQNFPGPGLEVTSAGSPLFAREAYLSTVNGGFFAQEQLDLWNWVYTTVGGRYDYASTFGKQAPGVFYPKVSVSVVPSDRPGWKDRRIASVLSQLRLRGAIGRSGRQPGAFDQFTTYGPIVVLPSATGLVPSNLGNPKLAPEVSTESEVGFELGLWDGRLGVQATGWNRVVNDLLIPVQYAPTGGFLNTQLSNVGQMKGRGLELGLTGQAINRRSVQLDLFANGAYLWQKVTDMGGAAPIKVGAGGVRYRNYVRVGYAPSALFGADIVRPCAQRPSGATYACLQPGQVPYDFNRDGTPDSQAEALAFLASVPRSGSNVGVAALSPIPVARDPNDPLGLLGNYLGKSIPDWTGSFGGTLTIRRSWRVNTLFEWRGGNYTVTNMTGAFMNALTIAQNSRTTAELDAVMQNPASTAQQRYDAAMTWANDVKALSPYDGLNQNQRGDFLRWRELGVTWTMPTAVAARMRTSSAALTAGVRNLALWTAYKGVDPESNQAGRGSGSTFDQNFAEGVDVFGLPLQRRFSLALRLGF